MAGNVQTLKEFLVALGFNVDASSEAKWNTSLAGATAKALELGAAAETAAIAVVAMVAKISSGMEQLYFVSQRTKSSVENIQAMGFAAAQMGSSVQAAQTSLENFANFLRSSPAAAGLVQSLGVNVYQNGRQRDATDIMGDLGRQFAQMPIWRAQAYASRLGIDQNTLFALINGLGQLTQTYKDMYKAAGLDSSGGSQQAHAFMVQLRTLAAAFEILGTKLAATLSGAIGGDIERFRQAIVANFQNISNVVVAVSQAIIGFADVFTGVVVTAIQVLDNLYKVFLTLDPQTQHTIEAILGLIAVWRALNIAFAMSPIGLLILLGGALLLLYQDYETWKKGGKSLVDWSQWKPQIDGVLAFCKQFASFVNQIVQAVGGWQVVFAGFLTYFMVTWSVAIIGRLGVILTMLAAVGRGMLLGGGGAAAATGAGAAAAGGGGGLLGWLGGAASTVGSSLLRLGGGAAFGLGLWLNMPGSGSSEAPYAESSALGKFDANTGGATGNGLAVKVRDILVKQYGWSPAAAAGIVANMMAESGLDPTKVGDNGQAYGIGQWHPDRQADFMKLFGHSIVGSSLGEQIAFYNAELRGHVDGLFFDSGAANAGALMNSTANLSPAQAAADVSAGDERPADKYGAALNRATWATQFATAHPFAGGGGGGVVVNQKTTIVAPTSATAKQLADHQGRVNSRLARNLNTAVDRGH